MFAIAFDPARIPASPWISLSALAGAAWNLFGLVQFVHSLTATRESLVAAGLTPDQALVMTTYPAWMTFAFGLGVTAGLVGSLLLLWRFKAARPVLMLSLAAYVALWIGDAIHGVFAVMGVTQIAILTLVVAIAAGLFMVSLRAPVRR